MRFQKAAQVIAALPNRQTSLLLGPPGIGKTALGYEVARLMDENRKDGESAAIVECRDLCSHLPEDLLGLPWRNGDVTNYCPGEWLDRLCRPGARGVLILDDVPAAAQAVQTAAFKLLLQRQAGDKTLAPGVKIIATGNRREDKAGASTLPSAFRNRCFITTLEPDADEWCAWAAKHGIPGVVAAFIRFKPGRLSMLPKDQDEVGAFATPRTWEMVGRAFDGANSCDAVFDVASGLIGQGNATEFTAFVRIRNECPDPKAILMDPEKACPNPPDQPDKLVAIVTAIGEYAAPMSKEKGKAAKEIPAMFLAAVAHVTKKHREYASAGILTFAANDGNVPGLIKAARDGKSDPRYKGLLQHLKGSLIG